LRALDLAILNRVFLLTSTIMPRGRALGLTMSLPEDDVDSMTRKQMNASIDVALGGRAAEELIYGIDETTSGCSSDLERATDVATRMVRVSNDS
jgi:ATP-dependent metalloprotease